jgi:hypothetical protein
MAKAVPRMVANKVDTKPMMIELFNASQTSCLEQTFTQWLSVKPSQTVLERVEALNENTIV